MEHHAILRTLEEMKGNTYYYPATKKEYLIKSSDCKETAKIIRIQTDKEDLTIFKEDFEEIYKSLEFITQVKELEEMGQALEVQNQSNMSIAHKPIDSIQKSTLIGSNGGEIANILMDNIRRVQEDPKFIAQAQATSDVAKTYIDLCKTEIDMYRVSAALSK